MPGATRFPIRFDAAYRVLSSVLLLPPSASFVEVDERNVTVRMGWAFRACFPCSAVASISRFERTPLSRGVHGFAGRWLVNGSGQGILAFELEPRQRGWVLGFPVQLRQLLVSVVEPDALARLLGRVAALGA
jgi:hypothetical protein